MLDLDEARAAIRREMSAAIGELEAVDADGWGKPTRCRDWTVADLVAHLTWGQRLEAQGVEGLATGRTVAVDVPPVPVADHDVLLAGLRAAHEDLRAHLEARTADDLERGAPMPYGPVPLRLLLQIITMEVGVHHSDLRTAIGLGGELAPDVVRATAAFLTAFLPLLATGGNRPARPVTYRLTGRQGNVDLAVGWDGDAWSVGSGHAVDGEGTVTLSGDDSDVCLFVLGRRALADAELRVEGDPDTAAAFQEFVPGP